MFRWGRRTLPALYPHAALFEAAAARARVRPAPGLTGLTVPHHLLARQLIADAFATAGSGWDRVVILCPDHFHLGGAPVSVVDTHFATPFGTIACDARLARALARVPGVGRSDLFFREHGFGSLLPFVKHFLPRAKVCAVAIKAGSGRDLLDRLAETLGRQLDAGTLLVQSTDFSHYLPLAEARARDAESRRVLLYGDPASAFTLREPGHIDSSAALYVQTRLQQEVHHSRPVILDHRNSRDYAPDAADRTTSYFVLAYQGQPRPEASLLFAGDVMLGREVEVRMRRRDPFRDLAPLLGRAGAAVANLEGPIAAPERTGPLCFHFPPESAEALARAGFTHLQLANNHALDQGQAGLDQTRDRLRQAGLAGLGDPSWEAEPQAEPVQVGPERVLLVPWNATGPYVQLSRMTEFLGGLRALHRRARIVVSVHWGTEYHGLADPRQTTLGRALVDAGADLVVGHHPHVVQNVERHNGGLIFHSLGNLVFDQWRREETRDGLLLKVTFPGGALRCELLPVEGRHAQPRLAEGLVRSRALAALAAKSSPELGPGIQAGLLLSPE